MLPRMAGTMRTWISRILAATKSSSMTYDQWFARAKDALESDPDSGVDTSQPFAQSVWVHSAINLISRTAASVPFVIRDEHEKDVTSGPLFDLINRPNSRQNDIVDFIIQTINSVLLGGHTFIHRADMEGLRPRQIFVRPIDKMQPDIVIDRWGDNSAPRWRIAATQEPLITDDEVFEWKLNNPYDDVYGLAPLSPARLALYCDVATGTYNKMFFENGARPGVVFSSDHPNFTQEQADLAKAMWDSKFRGAKRGHQTAFVGNGLKPHQIGYTYSDMEFPALKQMSKGEILAIYGVPNSMLGEAPKAAGVEIGGGKGKPEEENFILNVVMFWANQFCRFFDRAVCRAFGEYHSVLDFRQMPILQDRLLTRAKEGREWIKAGGTYNDVVNKFGIGLEQYPWGNDTWVPSNMLPARLLMNGPLAAHPGEAQRDSADAKDAAKALHLVEAA